MLLVWISIPVALGWRIHTEDTFKPVQQNPFHRMLFLTDSTPLESRPPFGFTGESEGSDESLSNKEIKTGTSNTHHLDTGKRGHSGKEKHSHRYGEELGKEGKLSSQGGEISQQHSSNGKDYSHKFKDRLLHKSGNYEKGYHDKYHLDEVIKHDNFWNNHHSHETFHKYGKEGASYHKAEDGQSANKHKQTADESVEEGKKGVSNSGHSASEQKGHKSEGGAESKYENKKEYKKTV